MDSSFIPSNMELLGFPLAKTAKLGLFNLKSNSSSSMVFSSAIKTSVFPQIVLTFNQATKVTLNYGDGTILQFEGTTITTGSHNYTDSNYIRVIVEIEITANLIAFSVTNWGTLFGNEFPMRFAYYPNLKTLTFNNTWFNRFDDGIYFSAIVSLTLVGGSSSTSPSDTFPPIGLTDNMQLNYLNLGNYDFSNGDTNKLDVLFFQQKNLTSLDLWYTRISASSLPQSMAGLTRLSSLRIVETSGNSPNVFPKIPFVITQLPALNSMILQSFAVSDVTALFDPQSIVKDTLTSLTLTGCTALPSNLGDYFYQLSKIKTIIFDSLTYTETVSGITRNFVDNFIDFIYSQVIGHAPITGTSASLLRSMTVSVSKSSQPTGEYKSPAGYVAGTANGSPASSLEKIWVMVNQYAHNWLYTINYISVTLSKVVGNVAVTVVCASKHNLRADASIKISGADQSGYNGSFTVASVVDDYTIKFNLSAGIEPGTATGTILLSSNL